MFIDLLRRHFPPCRASIRFGHRPHDSIYFSLDRLNEGHHRATTVAAARRSISRASHLPLKSHNLPQMSEIATPHREYVHNLLEGATWFYIVRDGRDVMCSFQRFCQVFDPLTPESISDFIRWERDGVPMARRWAQHAAAWAHHPRPTLVRFEDVVRDTHATLERVASFLGMNAEFTEPLLPAAGTTRAQNWVARLTRRTSSTNIIGRRAGQVPLKWRKAFSPEDRRFFHEHAGEILIELGYEPDDGWVGG